MFKTPRGLYAILRVSDTSSNSLVVAESAVAKQKVVHAALAASARFKRLKNDVAKPLAGEYIASNYRSIAIGRKN